MLYNTVTDIVLTWVCVAFTLNLGRLYWSRSASSSSSVTSILLLKRYAFWLVWLGLDEFWLGACLSNRAGRDFLSLPNTTVSQSFNHLSRQRLVNYSKTVTHNWRQCMTFWLIHPFKVCSRHGHKVTQKTYVITEKLCVVSGRKSVHPESRGLSLCVFRIIILFIFHAFRLHEHIVHIAGMWPKLKRKWKTMYCMSDFWCVRQTGGELPGQQLRKTLRFFHNLTMMLHDFTEREENESNLPSQWPEEFTQAHMVHKILALLIHSYFFVVQRIYQINFKTIDLWNKFYRCIEK